MIDKKPSWLNVDVLAHSLERGHADNLAWQLKLIKEIQDLIANGPTEAKPEAITRLRAALAGKEEIINNINHLANSNLTGTNKRKH